VDNKKLRFDGWVLDPESGDLERAGTRIRLQEQPMLVLKELLAHAGEVVGREQLIGLLWPKGVVDFDTGLNTAIRKLRSALGDLAETPRYIETLPRRGYRFIAPLDPEPEAASPNAPVPMDASANVPVAQSPERTPAGARWWLLIGIGTLLVAAVALWFTLETGQPWLNPLASAKFTRLTDLSGKEQAAAISRDGKEVVFLSDHDGPIDAWVTEIESASYRNLTQGSVLDLINPAVRTVGFSADGSLVTIWERRSGGSRSTDTSILAMPTQGGALRPYLADAAEMAWSSDGTQIVYHTSAPGDPLFVRELRQPVARKIHTAPAGVHCHFPMWSPDDAFIYFVRGVPLEAWDVWRIRPSGSDLERITFHDSLVSHPVLLDSRTLVYLASDADGSGPWLYGTDVKERVSHRISFGLERYTSLAASADGKRLVATVANLRTSLWSVSIAGDRAVQTTAVRITSDSVTDRSPRYGPNYLLYVSSRGGRQGIWKLANGTNSELWGDAQRTIMGAPAIAADGRRIAFTASDGARTFLYVMESDGTQARIVADSHMLRGDPAWAPDGQSIVSAVVRDGEPRLAIFYLNGNPPLALVSEYSIDPVWSPDGQFLLYSGADLGMSFPVRAVAGDGRLYAGLPNPILTRGARRVVFWPDGRSVVVLRGEIGHKNFWLVDLKTGAEHQLTELPSTFDVRGDFDISLDGGQITFDRVEESSEIALIERTH
jgi:DNA-binding winged helix-turn-helix (wHTH) protein/Tol biopolymer transport system component